MSISYSQKNFERKNQIKALVLTVLINSILFLLIWQVKIWNESPTPKIPNTADAQTGEITFEQEPPAPEPEAQQEITQTTEAEQVNTAEPITSTVESPVSVKKAPEVAKKEVKEAEPVIDKSFIYSKRTAKNNSSGNGNGTGSSAGNGNGSGSGVGGGGKGNGSGTGSGEGKIAQEWTFDTTPLKGIDNGTEIGEIIFFIRINEKGNVIEIRRESSNVNLSLVERYKKLIKNAHFSPKSEGNRSGGASGFKRIQIVPTN